jgi:hypothetical protein
LIENLRCRNKLKAVLTENVFSTSEKKANDDAVQEVDWEKMLRKALARLKARPEPREEENKGSGKKRKNAPSEAEGDEDGRKMRVHYCADLKCTIFAGINGEIEVVLGKPREDEEVEIEVNEVMLTKSKEAAGADEIEWIDTDVMIRKHAEHAQRLLKGVKAEKVELSAAVVTESNDEEEAIGGGDDLEVQ